MAKQTQEPENPFEQDLNPEYLAGRNYGDEGPDTTEGRRASSYKDLHVRLPQLDDGELASLPVVPEGTRLEQGKTYLDLNDLAQGELTGMANQSAQPGHYLVAKDAVGYDLWNKLLGDPYAQPQREHPVT